MARSTPGTRMRRALVKDLRTVKDTINQALRYWTPRSTVYVPDAEREANNGRWDRPRRPEEYPEARLDFVADAWHRVDESIKILVDQREQLAAYYHQLKAQQTAAATAHKEEVTTP